MSPPTTEEQRRRQRGFAARGGRTPYIPLPRQGFGDRDVRAKRPPLLSFLLRLETMRRVSRIVSLLAIDVGGVTLAIFTALALKAAVRDEFNARVAWNGTKDIVAFAVPVTILLFGRSGLYAGRAERPGLTRIVASLTQVAVVALLFAVINGETFSSYYVFYGSLFFAVLYISSLRVLYERVTGLILRAAGYQRRAVLVGTGPHIEAVGHALADAAHSPVDLVGFISVNPRPDNGLKA